ncbi:unnamed protein product [Prunus armeniaca]|uniref:Uncharacterized protein n=1 Tax=Prunus armeniaca TaxID=36596 RepID=A0A6J5XNN5_PRUAR|nr:unnamed protein product [Prunus armeniaca]CAB4312748.1 unnamed protein product [Prunus armeniaca]
MYPLHHLATDCGASVPTLGHVAYESSVPLLAQTPHICSSLLSTLFSGHLPQPCIW